jgi:hypothetical protein
MALQVYSHQSVCSQHSFTLQVRIIEQVGHCIMTLQVYSHRSM